MKKVLFSLLLTSFSSQIFAQGNSKTELKKEVSEQGIYGVFEDQVTKVRIGGVVVYLLDSSNTPIAKIISDQNGNWGFDLPTSGNYGLQYEFNGTLSQIVNNIKIKPEQKELFQFVVKSTPIAQANTTALSNGKVITSKEIEKLPQSSKPISMANRAGFYQQDGEVRSLKSGKENVYFVDGQRVNSAPDLVPGTVDQINIVTE
jgi:hypothetical protein